MSPRILMTFLIDMSRADLQRQSVAGIRYRNQCIRQRWIVRDQKIRFYELGHRRVYEIFDCASWSVGTNVVSYLRGFETS